MRNYLIIGGSSGIGKSVAELLHAEGAVVHATYNSTAPSNSQIAYHHLDIESEELDLSFVPEVLDGLVYAPGTINLKPFHRIKPEEFTKDYNLQVLGAVRVIQSVLNNLKKSDLASIVLFSTVAVQQGYNFHSQVAASKGAIEGLVKALAAEFAPEIRVNAVAPSITQTKLAERLPSTPEKIEQSASRHPLNRVGDPNDIANTVEFLLSEKSSWVTGQILHVDGGASTIRG